MELLNNCILIIPFVLLISIHEICAGIQQNWLKVISEDGHEYSVTSRQCFAGIWTPKPIQVKCVCVTGMWALSKGFCDQDFEILTGEQHCFPINRPIRKFSYIGSYWNQRRWFGNYVFRSDMPYVARFNSMDSEYFLNDNIKYVMRVNMTCSTLKARLDGSRSKGQRDEICVPETQRTHRSQSIPLIEVFGVNGRSVFQLGQKNQCSGRRIKPIVTMKPGQSWRPKLGEIRESTSIYPLCGPSKLISVTDNVNTEDRKPKPSLTTSSTTTRRHPPLIDFSTTTRRYPPLLDFNVKSQPKLPPLLDFKARMRTKHTTRQPKPSTTRSPSVTTRTTRSTTTRKPIIWTPRTSKPKQNLLWKPIKPNTVKPNPGPGADIDYEDDDRDPYWDSRSVPAEEKNQLLLEQTQRMLRMHVSFVAHGTKYMGIEKTEFVFLRIAKNILLKTCPEKEVPKPLVNAVIRLFRYALYESLEVYPYIVLSDKNEDARINKSLIECHESAQMMLFKYNSKCPKVIDSVVHNYEEYNTTLPESLASNATKLDFVLESVWKIMLHSHYYCAKNFGWNPADLSALMMKWEDFFSPVLRYRWRTPGNTWKLYQIIFQQYDLESFDQGLSKCLATSTAISHYPVWIQRPVLSLTGSKTKPKRRGKRSKREQCPPDQWNNQGYCIQKFFDPVRKYGVRPPDACLSEYNGRHDL